MAADPTTRDRILEATAHGFWQPEQLGLLTPYVPRYFADMPGMLARRTGMSSIRLS